MWLQLLQIAATASTLCDRPYQTKCLFLQIISWSCLRQASVSVYLRRIKCYRICSTYQLQSVLLVVGGWNLQLQPVVLMRLHNHYRHWSQGMEVAYQSYTLNLLQQQRTREVLLTEKNQAHWFCYVWRVLDTSHVSLQWLFFKKNMSPAAYKCHIRKYHSKSAASFGMVFNKLKYLQINTHIKTTLGQR